MKRRGQKKRWSEIEIAAVIVAWLRDAGWTVYQEVQAGLYGRRADIVAVIDGRTWVVECKRRHSFEVIEQSLYWMGMANWVSVATANRPRNSISRQRFHEMLGIGWLWCHDEEVEEVTTAALRRRLWSHHRIVHWLNTMQQTEGIAGSQNAYWTTFAETKRRIGELVKKEPGLTMKEIVDRGHGFHYASSSSARTALTKWIREGMIPNVEGRRDGKSIRYYPVKHGLEMAQAENHES
jgi:hypothetical protein